MSSAPRRANGDSLTFGGDIVQGYPKVWKRLM